MFFLEKNVDEIFSIYKHNLVVVWGTGVTAEKCVEIYKKYNIPIFAYCDNEASKWGTKLNGVSVLSPAELYELCMEKGVMLQIASRYHKEIKEQVKGYLLIDIITHKELYALNACCEIAEIYNINTDIIINEIQRNYECLGKIFDEEDFLVPRLENALEKNMTELQKKYGISICAIVKNEGDYIIEWIEYHKMVGVEHFYIYDNGSTDNLSDIINEYIENGIITYIDWPGTAQQLPVYKDAIKRYQYESKYIAFIDADEFLIPVVDDDLLKIVDDIFALDMNAGGIGVNWRTYGTSFHENRVEGLLFENYKYRAQDFHRVNAHIKTICNPRRTTGFTRNPHTADYKQGYYCISEHGSYIPDAFFFDGLCRKLRINHYATKSTNEYWERLKKGKADSDKNFIENVPNECLEILKNCNEVYDSITDRYVRQLKECIKGSK